MKRYTITVNGTPYDVSVDEAGAGTPVAASAPIAAPVVAAPVVAAPVVAAPAAPQAAAGGAPVIAPMPGNVLDVKVSAGQAVKAGDVLVILEAMKMENEIVAPQDGTIGAISVNKGDTVNVGDIFLTIV